MAAKKKKKKINDWDDDHYTQLAKKENYPARSVYKLKEIHKKCSVFRKGQRVLDLGCAPGSWLKYAGEMVGASGEAVGVDLKELNISLPSNCSSFVGDILEKETLDKLLAGGKFDVVMSDMAPNTVGNRHADSARSAALAETALYLAEKLLNKDGVFIAKVFQGTDFDGFAKNVLFAFKKRKIFKPDACRKSSKETYVIGMARKDQD